MNIPLPQVLLCLVAGIAIIVLLTSVWRVHAFFALLIASFVVGLGMQMPVEEIITTVKKGFGNIMQSLGLIIVLGTTIGVILEYTGSTGVLANYILGKVGHKRAPLAMSMTGFIVGLPIFCDSGYIVLSGLNNSIARKAAQPIAVMAVSMATGLYSVHCLIPPHPGASAAAGTMGVDFGKLILWGSLIAIPAALVGHLYARYSGRNTALLPEHSEEEEKGIGTVNPPSVVRAFLPIVVPIVLIALKSFFSIESKDGGVLMHIISILGDPVIALSISVLLALNCGRNWNKKTLGALLQDAAEKAGGILVIIGAGGAFGAVLAETNIGTHVSQSFSLSGMGLLFPFLLTCLLKTAQGSSTVAIITAASIVHPLLPALNIPSPNGPMLVVLAMGAGSMCVSHANDAYFWVVSKFSGLEMKTMLRTYSVASILMGVTSFLAVWVLSWVIG